MTDKRKTARARTAPISDPVLTVLRSYDGLMAKRFARDPDTGRITKTDYDESKRFEADPVPLKNIEQLGNYILELSRNPKACVIRGMHPSGQTQGIALRTKKAFPEHPEGTPWVMLDIDGVEPPDGLSPWRAQTIEWLIDTKLPPEFRDVTCFVQFSSSAGILGPDGKPLKSGIRVHLWFWLDRRVPGRPLAAYLQKFCLDTGFYTKTTNKGGVAMIQYGIDLAPIKSCVQVHYTADPQLGEGVECALTSRQGFIIRERKVVTLPKLAVTLPVQAQQLHMQTREAYIRELGYERHTVETHSRQGVAVTHYYRPPGGHAEVRKGRELSRHEMHGPVCRLFFTDENTPGSWYVHRGNPQWAVRYGDGERCPLKELSEGGYRLLRDELGWFQEIPKQSLALQADGFVPPIASFATARHSVLLAPTGSGKTTAVCDWIRDKSGSGAVIYAAPTIPLVDQMYRDLWDREISCMRYTEQLLPYGRDRRVFVTTYHSLHKILNVINAERERYYLVLDEIHRGLDVMCSKNLQLTRFLAAIRHCEKSLYMTGTLTQLQRLMLAQQVGEAHDGVLTNIIFSLYEFDAVKHNPLRLKPLAEYQADIVKLMEDAKADVDAGRAIPPTVVMTDSSRMGVYRVLAEQHGLSEHVAMVSRPETKEGDIEIALHGDQPIVVCSPIFNVGLNFAWQPERLWCRFAHIDADTNAIVQTINRANRGDTPCEVRIYANPDSVRDARPIRLQPSKKARDQLQQWFDNEADVPIVGPVDMPMLLDRNTYNRNRGYERHPNKALKQLIDTNGFQNYEVHEPFEPDDSDDPKNQERRNEVFKGAKKAALQTFESLVRQSTPGGACRDTFPYPVWQFEQYKEERRTQYLDPQGSRTTREIEIDELGVVMALCGLGEVSDAKGVDIFKLRVLMADRDPWISEQYYQHGNHNHAAADKIGQMLPLLDVMADMQAGTEDGLGLAKRLTRNKNLLPAFCALETSESKYVGRCDDFERLKRLRERARKGGDRTRKEAQKAGKQLVIDLLGSLGVTFAKVDGERDLKQPVIPANWDLGAMRERLRRRAALLRDLPPTRRLAREPDPERVLESLTKLNRVEIVDVSVCANCKFMFDGVCGQGKIVDYTPAGLELGERQQVFGAALVEKHHMEYAHFTVVQKCEEKKEGQWTHFSAEAG